MKFDYDTILTVKSLQKVGRSNKILVNFDKFEPYTFSLDVINSFRLERESKFYIGTCLML